ncbi:hypothetical protein ACG7TL_005472 [Trametes sanguinea]
MVGLGRVLELKAEFAPELRELDSSQVFGEEVGRVVVGIDIEHFNQLILDVLANSMILDVDMLRPTFSYRVPDNRRFTGRITRVLEYQQTCIILRVEHPYSPAIVTLAVPYPFYEGTRWWYIRLRWWFGYLTPDNDRHSAGKSIPRFCRSLLLTPTSGRAFTKHRLVGA